MPSSFIPKATVVTLHVAHSLSSHPFVSTAHCCLIPPPIPTAHRSVPLRILENALESGLWETAGHQGVGTMQ